MNHVFGFEPVSFCRRLAIDTDGGSLVTGLAILCIALAVAGGCDDRSKTTLDPGDNPHQIDLATQSRIDDTVGSDAMFEMDEGEVR